MKTRAAIAVQAGKPLVIDEIDLQGTKAGEVLIEVKATGVCHTDAFTLSGDDPEGEFPAIAGHGRWHCGRCGVRCYLGKTRRHGNSARLSVGMRFLFEPQNQPLPENSRNARPWPDARRHQPLFFKWQTHFALHGLLNLF